MGKDTLDLQKANRCLKQGQFIQAKELFQKCIQSVGVEAKRGYAQAVEALLKRYFRQGKTEALMQEAKGDTRVALAIARLRGPRELELFANMNHEEAWLAKLSMQASVKEALVHMRQVEGFKELAEGWLALIKKDISRAATSFKAALSKQPLRAQLGLAILDVLEGRFVEGEARLGSFMKVAMHRFQKFSLMMGRGQEGGSVVSKNLVAYFFVKGGEEDLQRLLGERFIAQKEEKGWLCLRLGDLVYSEKEANQEKLKKACGYWDKALNFFPKLELDVWKRKFLAYYLNQQWDEAGRVFPLLFHGLYRKNQELASQFLEYVVFVMSKSFYEDLSIPFYIDAQKKWSILQPPAAVCLFSMAVDVAQYQEILQMSLPKCLRILMVDSVKDYMLYLPSLELRYRHLEQYQLLKADWAFVACNDVEYRRSLACLMEFNPLVYQGKMVDYMQSAIGALFHATEGIKHEVEKLALLFPSQFDLQRLRVILGGLNHEGMLTYEYSAQLKSVFLLQIAIDLKKPTEKLIQDAWNLYGQDQEANWRFWHAITYIDDQVPQKQLKAMFKECFKQNHEALEFVFRHIMKYSERRLSNAFLKCWQGVIKSSWMMHYYLGINLLCEQDWAGASKEFFEATKLMNQDMPDFYRVMAFFKYSGMRMCRVCFGDGFMDDDDEGDEDE